MEDNVSILHRGIEKARKLIRDRYAEKMYQRGVAVCIEAENGRRWAGFTGQSVGAFSVGKSVSGSTTRVWSMLDKGVSPVSDKVQMGETVFLDVPYEGDARSVKGAFFIDYPDIGEGFDAIYSRPYQPSMGGVRFGYPIEYMKWLNGDEYDTPLELMHALARLALAGLR